MPVASTLRSRKAEPLQAKQRDPVVRASPVSALPEPGHPANTSLSESPYASCSSLLPPSSSPAAAGHGSSQAIASSKPSPSGGAPLTRAVSLLRQAPKTGMRPPPSSVATVSEPQGGRGTRLSLRSTAVTSAASASRSGIPTSLQTLPPSRASSPVASGLHCRPSDEPTSELANGPAELPGAAESPIGLPVGPGRSSRTPVEGLPSTSTSSASPMQPAQSSRPTARPSGVEGRLGSGISHPDGRERRNRTSSGRVALAETTANGIVAAASNPRRLSSPKISSSPTTATKDAASSNHKRTTSMLPAAPSSLRPSSMASTARAHRRSLSTTQAPSPSLARPLPDVATTAVPRPRPKRASVVLPESPVGVAAARAASPAAASVAAANTDSASGARIASAHATPTRIGVRKLSSAARSVTTAATPDRSAVGLGLPPRSSLSYPSPRPLQLDTLSPPMVKRPLPKTAVGRLSTAGRLAPRSSLVSFEAMSRTLLPPEDSLLIEDADATEFGVVALSKIGSPPSSFGARLSRQRREATSSSTDSGPDSPARDLFGLAMSGSSSAQSFIPLPVPATPQTLDISHAALRSRLQQSLLAQAALQRELDAERTRPSHIPSQSTPDEDDRTADITIELKAARAQLETLGLREEETREETAALEELLQASQDDLAAAETELRTLKGSLASLTRSSDATVQQAAAYSAAFASTKAVSAELLASGQRAMADQWEAVARRAREELATCRGEREVLSFLRSTTATA